MKTKKPWLAALLNIIFLGLGYVYVGKRKLFGALLLVSDFLISFWTFHEPETFKLVQSNAWVMTGGILIVIALAIDGYMDAKETQTNPS
jgi:hypothetical protein